VVEAAKAIVPIMADCSKNGPPELMKKFNVKSFPTVVFVSSKGEEIERLRGRDPASVKGQIESIAANHSVKLFLDISMDEAKKMASELGQLLAVCYMDTKNKSAEKNQLLQGALMSDGIKDLRDKFVFIKQPLRDGKKVTAEAKAFGASKSPTLLIIDPKSEEEGKKSVLKKIAKAKGLKKALAKVLKTHAKKSSK
jgi:hypothetical protein